ncbi:DNA polymerase III subunit delta' [Parvibaculum sp.]|uniref:DNA polymerase III subunit delta' n=1 Tax=Parvibaculum sp. TaxID=2024848 RepID=UPI0026132248|nr:DNA polymerase III subunit delta' [Parvibaculum sp.]MCW5728133.1 DNA polymerase III subunit delta' [Parvibaculum sp.]
MAEKDTPESDRLEPFAHPRVVTALYGHQEAERALFEAFMGGRMHHAWLMTGPKGIGKATLAYRFARFILHYGTPEAARAAGARDLAVPAESAAAHQVAAGSHPNLLTVRRPWDDKTKKFKTVLPVDEVRRIGHFFGMTAGGAGGWRIVVIDAADDMNPNAANALLKALEEPPPQGLFLVLSHQPGRLLPTIRSRCRALAMKPLGAAEIVAAMTASEAGAVAAAEHEKSKYAGLKLKAGEAETIARLADGSAGRALAIAAGGGLALYKELAGLLSALPRLDIAGVHALADKAARRGADDAFETLGELLTLWLQRLIRAGAGLDPGPDIAAGEGAAMARLTDPARGGASLDRWVEVWEKIGQSIARGEALNTDRKLTVLNVFSMLEAVASERAGA